MMKAAEALSVNSVSFLLKLGANPLEVDNSDRTALKYAEAAYQESKVVKILKRAE